MKILLMTIASSCLIAMGFYSGVKATEAEKEKDLMIELIESSKRPPSRSLAFAIAVATEQSKRGKDGARTEPSVVEKAIERVRLSPHDSDLFQVMGNDSLGAEFRSALVAHHYTSEVPGASLLFNQLKETLQNDPANGLVKIQTVLNRLPLSGFPMERVSLLQLMGELPNSAEATKAQALSELTQNPVPSRPNASESTTEEEENQALSTTIDMGLPIFAHQLFLERALDAPEALQGTLQGISSQPDHGIKRALAIQLVEKFPDTREGLQANLKAQNEAQNLHLLGF